MGIPSASLGPRCRRRQCVLRVLDSPVCVLVCSCACVCVCVCVCLC